jgi:SNF2-related domain/LAGLIDADG-like domain/Helicase conserved C-terminal domain
MTHVRHYGRGEYGIEGRYDERVRSVCRGNDERHIAPTPGMRWEPAARAWVGYIDAVATACDRLRDEFHVNVDTSDLQPADSNNAVEPLKARDIRKYQAEGANFILTHGEEGCLLADDMGLGKEQPIDEPVLTPTGWQPIGELRVGDFVIGRDGKPTKVVGVFPQGEKPVYRVTFSDGAWTRCGIEHLWAVRTPADRRAGRGWSILSLKQIVELGLRQPGTTNRRFFVPLVTGDVLFESGNVWSVDPYLLGALLANGSLTRAPTHSGTPDQVAAFSKLLPASIVARRRSKCDVAFCPRDRGGPNALREALRELGLIGTFSHTKFVPRIYLHAPPSERAALLQGLLDNDGTVSRDGMTVEYNTTSPQLAEDVTFLVRSLGGVARRSSRIPTYTYKGERLRGRRDYRIRLSLPPGLTPFRIERKVSRFKPREKYLPARAIDSVEPVGRALCVCIRVEAEDHLYVTRDFIVTHNTVQALRAMRALRFQGPSMVVCPNYAKGVWRDETKRWWPEAETIFLDGTKPEKKPELLAALAKPMPRGGRLIVCNYDILHAWVGLFTDGEIKLAATGESFKPPVLLAFDEASFLQSEKSRRSKAAKELARVSRRRVGLDGTPPADKPKDLWNLVDTLSEGRFGKFFPYALRHCNAHRVQVTREKAVWDFSGESNLDELRKRVAFFTLRRTQKDVALELPELTRQIINVEVPRGHRGPLGMALQSEAAMRRVLDLAADGKVPHVIALAESHLKAGHHVVVFTHRRAIAEAIAKAFGNAGAFIHGGMSQTKRDEVLKSKPSLLAATLDTAGRGLNDLVYYNVAIFAELHWVPSVLAQAEKRPHRPGQTRAVLIQYVIAEGTADELIRDGCIRKLQTRVSVLGKLDDGLLEQLDGDMRAGGVAALRALAESLGMT